MTSTQVTQEERAMKWKKIKADGVLTFWPGTSVRESDINGPEGIHAFFQKAFGIQIIPVGCVETLPDKNDDGEEVVDTGGRIDFFFFVNTDDVSKFALKRFSFGMRWWEDVYFNEGEDIYPIEFRKAYPDPCDRNGVQYTKYNHRKYLNKHN